VQKLQAARLAILQFIANGNFYYGTIPRCVLLNGTQRQHTFFRLTLDHTFVAEFPSRTRYHDLMDTFVDLFVDAAIRCLEP